MKKPTPSGAFDLSFLAVPPQTPSATARAQQLIDEMTEELRTTEAFTARNPAGTPMITPTMQAEVIANLRGIVHRLESDPARADALAAEFESEDRGAQP